MRLIFMAAIVLLATGCNYVYPKVLPVMQELAKNCKEGGAILAHRL